MPCGVPRVTTDFGDETGPRPLRGPRTRIRNEHLFHDSSHRRYEGASKSGQDGGNRTAMGRAGAVYAPLSSLSEAVTTLLSALI